MNATTKETDSFATAGGNTTLCRIDRRADAVAEHFTDPIRHCLNHANNPYQQAGTSTTRERVAASLRVAGDLVVHRQHLLREHCSQPHHLSG